MLFHSGPTQQLQDRRPPAAATAFVKSATVGGQKADGGIGVVIRSDKMKKAFRPGGQHFQGDGISDINTAVDRNVHPVIFALAVRDAVLHHPVEVSDVGGRDPQPPSNLLSKDPRVDSSIPRP